MAALDEVKTYANGSMVTASGISVTEGIWDDFKPVIAAFFWKWYNSNTKTILLRVGWLFIHFTIRVQDLHDLFETLFGPEPAAAPVSA